MKRMTRPSRLVKRSMRRRLLLLLPAVAVALSGCQSCAPSDVDGKQLNGAPFSAAFAVGLKPGMVKRVVLLPIENHTASPQATADIHQKILGRLRSSGMFEIVDGSTWLQTPCTADEVACGEFVESLLVRAYQEFNADAVMFLSVNELHAYTPMSLGVTLHIVETYDAQLLATIDGFWSQENSLTAQHFEQFVCRTRTEDHEQAAMLSQSRRLRRLRRGRSCHPSWQAIRRTRPEELSGAPCCENQLEWVQLPSLHFHSVPNELICWTAQQVKPTYEHVLASWPSTLRLVIEGLGEVLFCHATPRNNSFLDSSRVKLKNRFDFYANPQRQSVCSDGALRQCRARRRTLERTVRCNRSSPPAEP